MRATDWTIITVTALVCLTYLAGCQIRVTAKRIDSERSRRRDERRMASHGEMGLLNGSLLDAQ